MRSRHAPCWLSLTRHRYAVQSSARGRSRRSTRIKLHQSTVQVPVCGRAKTSHANRAGPTPTTRTRHADTQGLVARLRQTEDGSRIGIARFGCGIIACRLIARRIVRGPLDGAHEAPEATAAAGRVAPDAAAPLEEVVTHRRTDVTSAGSSASLCRNPTLPWVGA